MAVSKKSDTDQTPTTGSTITYSSFDSTGTNPVIIVLIALDSTTATVSSVVCSGGLTSGTPVEIITKRDALDFGETYASVWAIPAPSGTGTITVNLSASVPWQSNAILFENTDQTTPCPTGAGNASSLNGNAPNPLSITLGNLTANDAAVGMGCNAAAGDAPSFDQTQTYINNTTNVNMSCGFHLGTGAVSCTWGSVANDDVFVAIRIVAFSGAADDLLGQGVM